jgi:hypothetical protein
MRGTLMLKIDKKSIIGFAVLLIVFWGIGIWFPNVYVEYKGVDDNVYSAGEFGDQFGGLNALNSGLAFIAVVVTFMWQYSAQKKQQIENNFFKMLEFHRANYEKLHSLVLNERQILSFNLIGVKVYSRKHSDHEYRYLDFINLMITQRTKDGAFFEVFSNHLEEAEDKYKQKKLKVIKQKLLEDKPILGHYFRHVYHIVKYIDDKKELTNDEKKIYGDILRAQLSDIEMALLFYNSLTEQGKKMREYIIKYRLIHNIDYKEYNLNLFMSELEIDESYFEDYENKG